MTGFRATLPLCLLCCLLAAISGVLADGHYDEPHHLRHDPPKFHHSYYHSRYRSHHLSHRKPHDWPHHLKHHSHHHHQLKHHKHHSHHHHQLKHHQKHHSHHHHQLKHHRHHSHHHHQLKHHRHHSHHHHQLKHHKHHSHHHHKPKHHKRNRRYRVRVRTACHGRTLRLGCHHGYQIRVLNVFYGRYSARICPKLHFKHGHRQHGGHASRCSAKHSRSRASRICHGKRHCHLIASEKLFGKSCSLKDRPYLRVRYTCVFKACKKVLWLQAKLLKLIDLYGRLGKKSYGYWRRKHFRQKQHRLKLKLNKLRKRFHSCFKCRRGCSKISKMLSRIKRAENRIRKLLDKLEAKRKSAEKKKGASQSRHEKMKWHATRQFLKRKLVYMRARHRALNSKLRHCKRVCRY